MLTVTVRKVPAAGATTGSDRRPNVGRVHKASNLFELAGALQPRSRKTLHLSSPWTNVPENAPNSYDRRVCMQPLIETNLCRDRE